MRAGLVVFLAPRLESELQLAPCGGRGIRKTHAVGGGGGGGNVSLWDAAVNMLSALT